jgi:hypothetical protein
MKAKQMFTWLFGKDDDQLANCENFQVLWKKKKKDSRVRFLFKTNKKQKPPVQKTKHVRLWITVEKSKKKKWSSSHLFFWKALYITLKCLQQLSKQLPHSILPANGLCLFKRQ